MSVRELMHEIETLPDAEQREILAWLAKLRETRDDAYLSEITGLIDDRNPERWHSADDFKRALGDD